jgi:hypothetical protein
LVCSFRFVSSRRVGYGAQAKQRKGKGKIAAQPPASSYCRRDQREEEESGNTIEEHTLPNPIASQPASQPHMREPARLFNTPA